MDMHFPGGRRKSIQVWNDGAKEDAREQGIHRELSMVHCGHTLPTFLRPNGTRAETCWREEVICVCVGICSGGSQSLVMQEPTRLLER